MSEPLPERRSARDRKATNWGLVLGLLVLTCIAMLGAIYWVVRTGKL
ncbi:MAG TPA: hypothetical protein VHU80_00245 [Polyangiaceae bacterium]|jgi:hypothetical protein|nr:hypothetical protein [Polyangiaceae bacterium]